MKKPSEGIMTKTPGQIAYEAHANHAVPWDVTTFERRHWESVAAAVIAHARPQIEAEMTANMHHFADTVIEKLKGQIETEARAAMAEQCAQVCEDADDVQSKRDTYYAQLGDASATRHSCAAEIRALAALPPTHHVVPIQWTDAMFAAGESQLNHGNNAGDIYEAMLATSKGNA